MIELTHQQARQRLLKIALLESAFALSVVILSLVSGAELMLSASLGVVLFVLPNAYFILSAFRTAGAVSANEFLRRFFRGHSGKLVLTFVAFALVFHLYANVHAPMLFACYGAMWVVDLGIIGGMQRLSKVDRAVDT